MVMKHQSANPEHYDALIQIVEDASQDKSDDGIELLPEPKRSPFEKGSMLFMCDVSDLY